MVLKFNSNYPDSMRLFTVPQNTESLQTLIQGMHGVLPTIESGKPVGVPGKPWSRFAPRKNQRRGVNSMCLPEEAC